MYIMKRFKAQQTYFLFSLILSVFIIFLSGCGGKSEAGGGGGVERDTTAPTVTFTVPANGATGVPIGNKLSATFSEAMDPLTITNLTFTLKQGVTAVLGTATYSGVTAVFTPTILPLTASTVYTATITTGAKDLAGNALASNYVWSFTTGAASDTTAPTVTLTAPVNAATGVAINKKISATFSEAMDPLTITGTTFTVVNTTLGGTAVAGTVTYVGLIATFTPTSNLAISTIYIATITMGAKDLAANALASNYVWSFTTGAAADTTKPTVTLTDPANAATGVAINKKISATFSEAMDPLTITNLTFTVTGPGGTPVTGTVILGAPTNIATFTPTSNLAVSTIYTATITMGAKDLAANALASNYVWSFTTGAAADTTAPTVTLTDPANTATGVALSKRVSATFSEAMDPLTITNLTFTLQGATAVPGTVTYVGLIATFTPASNLAVSTTYTATITTGAKDLAGNPLASDYVWSFTTGAGATAGPQPVDLGTAGDFVILSKSGITNVPTSAITGNIGTSPITGASITGLGCPEVTGIIYTVDAAGPACRVTNATLLTTAVSDMETAYTDAAGRAAGVGPNLNLNGGTLNGQVLAPGTYTWNTPGNVHITGDFTLNGSATDIWIFQISGTLAMDTATHVILTGGALPQNVFWQVAGVVAIGTTVHFEGIILAQTQINLLTSASMKGRALAQTQVTLQGNAITVP